ncbi:MAG: helix-turn-helix domain-containing protein [Pseudomonadota bacterium]
MDDDDTLDLAEAAKFLKMNQESLRQRAKAGEIPGAKPGKRWCFLKSDLIAYLRSRYSTKAQAVLSRGLTGDRPPKVPDSSGPMPPGYLDSEYRRLLGLDEPAKKRAPRKRK